MAVIFPPNLPIIRNMTQKPTYFPILILLSLLLLVISCGGGKGTNPQQKEYTLDGVLFYNSQNFSSLFYANVTQNGSGLAGLTVKVGGVTSQDAGNGIYAASNPGLSLTPGDTYTVSISSGDTLIFSAAYALPDTFSVTVTDPASHFYYGSGFVTLEWTGSANAKGYIVTVVRPDSALAAAPYAKYVELTTGTQIGQEAFQTIAGTNVYGDYDIYVLAHSTSNFYSWPTIFFPLPVDTPTVDNIQLDNVTGTFSVGTLSRKDYVTFSFSQ